MKLTVRVPNVGTIQLLGCAYKVCLDDEWQMFNKVPFEDDWYYQDISFAAVFTNWYRWQSWHPWSESGDDTDYSLFDTMSILVGDDFKRASKFVRRGYTRDDAAMKIISDDELHWSRVERDERRAER